MNEAFRSPPPSPPAAARAPSDTTILLEGYLLKQGSLSRKRWHDRYFVFCADNTLHYYDKHHHKDSGNTKPKAVYQVTNSTDCLVSELFVERHSKKLVYCVRLSWNNEAGAAADFETDGGGDSTGNITYLETSQQLRLDDSSSFNDALLVDEPPPVRPQHHKSNIASVLRRLAPRKHSRKSSSNSIGARSVDAESITMQSTETANELRKRKHSYHSVTSYTHDEQQQQHQQQALQIPFLVEVEQRFTPPQTPKLQQFEQQQQQHHPPIRTSRSAYDDEQHEEQLYLRSQYMTAKEASKKRNKQKVVQGTKLAAAAGATVGLALTTAGIGLVVGLVLFGAALAGGGSAAVGGSLGRRHHNKRKELVIASPDYDTAKAWKACFDAAVESSAIIKSSTWGQLFSAGAARWALLPKPSRDEISNNNNNSPKANRDRTVLFESSSKWRPLQGGWAAFLGQGLRIFREERDIQQNMAPTSRQFNNSIVNDLSVDGKPCAPVKSHIVLSTSALNAFLCVMSYGCAPPDQTTGTLFGDNTLLHVENNDENHSFRIVETIDDSTDVIHLVTRPLYLFPSTVAPRDFVLFRYWRLEPDGKYIICYESVEHDDCPPVPGRYVRGDMHQVITISPHNKKRLGRRDGVNNSSSSECLMTVVVQVDPKGWVPTMPISWLANQSYGDAFGVAALLRLLEIRDAIDLDRFVAKQRLNPHNRLATTSSTQRPDITTMNSMDSGEENTDENILNGDFADYDYAYACNELGVSKTMSGLASTPPPLDMAKWVAPDSNSFRVRGKYYKEDRQKCNAGPSIGRLVAVDVVAVDKPIYSGLTTHPTERVQLALRKEAVLKQKGMKSDMPAFIFAVNIVLPGPPVYHAVFYYAVDDKSTIDGSDGTPSSKLCNQFFFGDSDVVRDRTFKLIPHIVQGNFIVRKAVGSTPAVIGRKLRQIYIRNDRFFELIMDCGSSPVAAGIIRISLGYARSLVVDMAFLLEADDPSTLPERIFGCVRVKNMDFGPHMRFVQCPPSGDDGEESD